MGPPDGDSFHCFTKFRRAASCRRCLPPHHAARWADLSVASVQPAGRVRVLASASPAPVLPVMPRVYVVNPSADDAFRMLVEKEGEQAASPPELQARLRESHPKALVRPRQLEGERSEIWYVYRDGQWVASP